MSATSAEHEVKLDPVFPSIPHVDQLHDTSIRDIWRQSLGPKAQAPQAHILRIGVGLKRIVRLMKAIKEELGVKVPVTALLRLGTVDALVEAIQDQNWPPATPCLLLKDGDRRPPLYVFSAGSGLVLELCDLVRLMDYPGQIWGLQLPGLDGEVEPLDNLPAIGQYYATAIVDRQPTGPYNLIGYSFGGSAAVETARHLAAIGGKIGLVGLIDSNLDERNWPKSSWFAGIVKRCIKRAAEARHLPPKQAIQHIAVRAVNLFRYFGRKAAGETAASIYSSAYYIGGFEPDFQRVRDAAIIAYQTYTPRTIDFPLTLFRSELGDPHACDPVPVWRQFARRMEVVDVPGSHTTMVRRPHARTLGAKIVARL